MDDTARRGTPCPTCGKSAAKQEEALPFCSARCRAVDLGGWLDERYRIATDEGHSMDDEPSPS